MTNQVSNNNNNNNNNISISGNPGVPPQNSNNNNAVTQVAQRTLPLLKPTTKIKKDLSGMLTASTSTTNSSVTLPIKSQSEENLVSKSRRNSSEETEVELEKSQSDYALSQYPKINDGKEINPGKEEEEGSPTNVNVNSKPVLKAETLITVRTVRNPLFGSKAAMRKIKMEKINNVPSIAQIIKDIDHKLTHFSKLAATSSNFSFFKNSVPFDAVAAATSLEKCIEYYPLHVDSILEAVLRVQSGIVNSKSKLEKLYETFAIALTNKDNLPFFRKYFDSFVSKEQRLTFVRNILRAVRNKGDLIPVLSKVTEEDFAVEVRQTFLRNDSLCNTLCKEYANMFLENEFASLKEFIDKAFKGKDMLSLDTLHMHSKDNNSKFSQLSFEKQREELKKHAEDFMVIATNILDFIYNKMTFSNELVAYLGENRKHCMSYLANDNNKLPSDKDLINDSRVLFSGFLFLKVINPYITGLVPATDLIRKRVYTQLSKIIQNLANEIPFGSDKEDTEFFGTFDAHFKHYAKQHQNFVDRLSL